MHSDSANRAGRAFCLAAEKSPELAGKIRSAGEALVEAATVNAADMIEAAGQLEQWGFTRPIELEDWRRVALAGGLPFEVVRAGDFTARDAIDGAGGLVDRATVEGKHGRQQPAKTRRKRTRKTGDATESEADTLLMLAMQTHHGYEDLGTYATVENCTPLKINELIELTRRKDEPPVAKGTASEFVKKHFGRPGFYCYRRRCRDAAVLADVLHKMNGLDRLGGGRMRVKDLPASVYDFTDEDGDDSDD